MEDMVSENYFKKLNDINVNGKAEKKNGLTYLSWAFAWAEVKKLYPDSTYTIYENADGLFYHTDGMTCWVKTGVTINGIEHIEFLPVMDNRNRSIPRELVTSFDVNKAIQRSLTKACARHGIGLYIYAGEDLPEAEKPEPVTAVCELCAGNVFAIRKRDGTTWEVADMVAYSKKKFGHALCAACMKQAQKEQDDA